ncbi:hypothetical protein BZA05DRAFT_394022 [Tricharina praecox]|uniref:uncharacterized protein n=1 Tax=Tricharina praecox TaxID=43433 RepID=UPI00222019DB|nr:uncharacterized protein BZA05DRAFT_394022 [Tricharina praecox]KAI5854370.1 hypothetical protein BZA05DRAFT_394022 [Tricharina praecox]
MRGRSPPPPDCDCPPSRLTDPSRPTGLSRPSCFPDHSRRSEYVPRSPACVSRGLYSLRSPPDCSRRGRCSLSLSLPPSGSASRSRNDLSRGAPSVPSRSRPPPPRDVNDEGVYVTVDAHRGVGVCVCVTRIAGRSCCVSRAAVRECIACVQWDAVGCSAEWWGGGDSRVVGLRLEVFFLEPLYHSLTRVKLGWLAARKPINPGFPVNVCMCVGSIPVLTARVSAPAQGGRAWVFLSSGSGVCRLARFRRHTRMYVGCRM